MYPALNRCPVCKSELTVTRLHCSNCDTVVEGRFTTGTFGSLTPDGVREAYATGLPLVLAIFVWPLIFIIEIFGLAIRHSVLAVRLLANMFAGHLVLAVIVGFIAAAANTYLAIWLGVTTVGCPKRLIALAVCPTNGTTSITQAGGAAGAIIGAVPSSAWPLLINNCSITGNVAVQSVSRQSAGTRM